MTSHRRVKDIAYDDEDLYSDEDEPYTEDQGYTEDDKRNFADLTPVVQAHLSEDGVSCSDKQIEEALWHYYWDVAKSVDYLKKLHTPKSTQKQAKPKSKFDQAAEKLSTTNDHILPLMSLPPGPAWFEDIPWTDVSNELVGNFRPVNEPKPLPKLLGGSSKLAKLAEERRKKAAAVKSGIQDRTNEATTALDRLSLNTTEAPARKYPIKKKREPTPPPPEPEPVEEMKQALPDLRAPPSEFGRTLSTTATNSTAQQKMCLTDVFGDSGPRNAFQELSPDDIVLKAHGQSKSVAKATKSQSSTLKVAPTATTPTVVKPKSQLPDAVKLWKQSRTTQRPFASFVVAGHVDHGKSTLMGRLLLDTGAVQQRDIEKFRKQAAEIGKESFALAWVMDTGSEERERGITVDVAQHHFTTDKADFTILDAPGHRDFVPSMISGATMADIVVLVVDANQLESGIKGQTREHVQLAYGVGIRKIVVAVNKLDASNPPWSQGLFDDVKDQISKLLRQVGFSQKNMLFVPCSGLHGENVANAVLQDSAAAQIKGGAPSLVSALESFTHDDASHYANSAESLTQQEAALTSKTLRMQIADVYRGGIQNPLSISGRITSGSVVEGQAIAILPSGDQAVVKGVERAGEGVEWAVALQIVALHLDGDIETLNRNLRVGDLVCSMKEPARLIKSITTKVQVLDTILPQAVELHYGRLHIAASIKRLIETLDAKGERLKKSPRSLKTGQVARIEITFDKSVPLEADDRIILRSDGATIAFGLVESVIS